MISQSDVTTSGIVVVPLAAQPGILPTIQAAAAQFEGDLPELLRERSGQWVIYHGARLLGFGGSKTELLQACYARGYPDEELYVARIEEDASVSIEW